MTRPDSKLTARKRPLPAIELQILLQLARGPSHGYQMMQQIAANTGGRFTPGPGTLYVALRRLVERRLIEPMDTADAPTKRQRYRLTSSGRETLDRELVLLDDLLRQARLAGWSRPGAEVP